MTTAPLKQLLYFQRIMKYRITSFEWDLTRSLIGFYGANQNRGRFLVRIEPALYCPKSFRPTLLVFALLTISLFRGLMTLYYSQHRRSLELIKVISRFQEASSRDIALGWEMADGWQPSLFLWLLYFCSYVFIPLTTLFEDAGVGLSLHWDDLQKSIPGQLGYMGAFRGVLTGVLKGGTGEASQTILEKKTHR